MRLKYKKLVVLFSLGIMLIGLGTFSMLAPNFSTGRLRTETADSDTATFGAIKAVSGKTTKDIQEEIEALVAGYMDGKQRVDMETLKSYVSDVSNIEETKLMADAEYIEKYENIQCKILDGATKGAYRVYAYCDVKLYDIDTRVPSLTALYVKLDENDRFQIYLGTLDSKEQRFIEELDASPEVKELIDTVQRKLETVKSSDSKVREFYDMLESVDEPSQDSKTE